MVLVVQIIVNKSVCNNKWVLYNHDIPTINYMISKFGISSISSNILLNRIDFDENRVSNFLSPNLDYWLDRVELLKDIDIAVEYVIKAINSKQKICILGDYDVDGITSSFMLYDFFTKLGLNAEIYIPNRLTERYGPTDKSFQFAKSFGATLCIAVDCGSSAIQELKYAKSLGMDVIVIDHHLIEQMPDAVAIINPSRPDDKSNLNNLCAAGLTCFVIYFLCKKLNRPWNKDYIDLAAIGTICDVMLLVDYNRSLVKEGLEKIKNDDTLLGIKELIKVAGINLVEINSEKIAFGLGPRINAAGRLGKHEIVLDLFKCDSFDKASQLANEINEMNIIRKNIEKDLLNWILAKYNFINNNYIFAIGEDWHEGVLGIVASKISNLTNKPSLIMTARDSETIKGSGRSVAGFNIGDVIKKALSQGILNHAGGHKMAVGFSLNRNKVDEFKLFIENEIKDIVFEKPCLKIDAIIDPIACNKRMWNDLTQLEPYGNSNSNPIFMMPNVKINNFRNSEKYVSCNIYGNSRASLRGFLFKNSSSSDLILALDQAFKNNSKINCLGHFQMNFWQGKAQPNFLIKDICII